MADNNVFTVTLKTVADISDVKHNIDALQNSFKKLKLPDKIGENLQKNISNFMKEYDKYQTKLAQGIQTPGDQRVVNKSLNAMLNSYEKIIADAYIENGDFFLTSKQRKKAYVEYKKTRG